MHPLLKQAEDSLLEEGSSAVLAEPAEQDDGPAADEDEDIPVLDVDYDVDPEFEPVLADAGDVGGIK